MKEIHVPIHIKIKGYVKSDSPPNAYTIYGFIKSLMKKKLVEAGALKFLCFPMKDSTGFSITRCLEPSPNWSICAKMKWWLTPWAHIVGISPLQWKHIAQLGLSQLEAMALFNLIYGVPKARMNILEEPKWDIIEYTQGTRDEIDTIKVGNPHEVKLWKPDGHYNIVLYYRPFPADASRVPTVADEIINYDALDLTDDSTYNDVIVELLRTFAEEMQGVDEVPSTFGGRKFNSVEIKVGEPEIKDVENIKELKLNLEQVARKLKKCSYTEESMKLLEEATKGGGHQRKRYGSFA